MTIRFCSLSSGSSGNCQFLETKDSRILIDSGFSGVHIERLLASIDVEASTIDGIFITHEHTDHMKSAGVLSRRYNIPIFANKGTWQGMEEKKIGKIKDENIKVFTTNKDFSFRDLGIKPFKIYHDAREPVGYSIYIRDKKLSFLTDTGMIDEDIKWNIKESDLLLIESNHDKKMLANGPYPYFLKERVRSNRGHLSNCDAGKILKDVLKGEREHILLGHLSRDNNIPGLAHNTVKSILEESGLRDSDFNLYTTYKDRPTQIYNIE